MLDPIKRTIFNGYLRNGTIDALDVTCFDVDTPAIIVNDSYILRNEKLANGDYHFLILHEGKFKHLLYSGNPDDYSSTGNMYNIDQSLFFNPLDLYLRSLPDGLITLDDFLSIDYILDIKKNSITILKDDYFGLHLVLYDGVVLSLSDASDETYVGYVTK